MASGFLKRIENGYIRPALRRLRPSRHVRYAGIGISYRAELMAAEQILDKTSYRFSRPAECQSKGAFLSGVQVRGSYRSLCSDTAFARRSVWRTSIRTQ